MPGSQTPSLGTHFNSNNQLTIGSSAYDGTGNLKIDPDGNQITYDAENRMTQFSAHSGNMVANYADDGDPPTQPTCLPAKTASVEVDANGNLAGRMIQWHPVGGRHGPHPYWKVSSGPTATQEGWHSVQAKPLIERAAECLSNWGGQEVPKVDIYAPIVADKSLGGLALRVRLYDIQDLVGSLLADSCQLKSCFEAEYSLAGGKIGVAVDVRNGKVFRLTAYQGYEGKLFGSIRVGTSVGEAFSLEPKLYYDEAEELILCRGICGVSLEVQGIDPDPEAVPAMTIEAISVFAEEIDTQQGMRGIW